MKRPNVYRTDYVECMTYHATRMNCFSNPTYNILKHYIQTDYWEIKGRSPSASLAILAKFQVSVSFTCQDAVTMCISVHGTMVHTIKNCIYRAAITPRNSCFTLSVPAFILSITTACNFANSRPKASILLHIIQVIVHVCTYNKHTKCNAHSISCLYMGWRKFCVVQVPEAYCSAPYPINFIISSVINSTVYNNNFLF